MLQVQGAPQPTVLKYKTEDKARKQFAAIVDCVGPDVHEKLVPRDFLDISDDYGHRKAFYAHQILSFDLIDMMKDLESQAENALVQARAQANVNRKMQSDPALKLMQAAPPIPFLS